MYVKKITSNIGGDFTHALGPKTLIIGSNGTGKTMIMRAVELALRGKTSDLIWRQNVAAVEALAALAGPTTGVVCDAVFDDGAKAHYSFAKRAAGGYTKPKHVLPEGFDMELAFPLELFKEAALGSDAKLHRFLVRHATGEILLKDVLARIPATLHDAYNRIAAEKPGGTDQIDVLLHVAAQSKARAKTEKTRAEGANMAAQASMAGVVPPDESALARARADVLAAQEMVERAAAKAGAQEAILRAREAAQTILRLESDRRALVAELAELPQLTPDVRAALGTVIWHAQIAREECLVCASPLAAGVRDDRAAKARARLAAHDRAPRLAAQIATVDRQLAIARLTVADAPAPAALAGVLPIHEAQRLAQAAQTDLRALEDADLRFAQASRSRDAAAAQLDGANRLAQLAEACSDAVALFLVQGAAAFSRRCQGYLPNTDAFRLAVDAATGSVRYGLVRGGVLHSALSGAETIRVSAAIASAVAVATLDRPTLILGEDRAWDPGALSAALGSLRESPAQILLPSTVEPSFVPTGWTVIRLADRAAA